MRLHAFQCGCRHLQRQVKSIVCFNRDDHVGAVCARTHPIGSGPLVWYQIFDYAVGHWFQKTAEHVLGYDFMTLLIYVDKYDNFKIIYVREAFVSFFSGESLPSFRAVFA